MGNTVADAADALARALDAPGWLALGVLLHLANQVARGRGWWAILRPAAGHDPALRRRDAVAAWMAGAGAAGVTFARGGDAVRVLLLLRRVPQVPAAVLAGTLVAEGAGELAGGLTLVPAAVALGAAPGVPLKAVAVAVGVAALALIVAGLRRRWRPAAPCAGLAASGDASSPVSAALLAPADSAGPAVPAEVPCGAALLAPGDFALAGWRARVWRRIVAVGARIGCGCAALPPGAFARQVVPWQFVARMCRLAALGCFLAAFGLPVTPAAILLVVFAQGGGRLVPFAPASVGAGAAMLAAAFEPVTGTPVPAADVAAFFLGTSAVLTIAGTAVATAICLRAAQASPKQGLSAWLTGRRARARVAAAPRT
jgi:uncharacterized membrane protein YbhN (UPF0104 family)